MVRYTRILKMKIEGLTVENADETKALDDARWRRLIETSDP